MIKVYKFDIFTSYIVDPRVLISTGGSKVEYSFKINYRSKENDWIVPVPKTVEVLDNLKNTDGELKQLKQAQNTYRDFSKLDNVYSSLKKNKEYIALKEKANTIEERLK